MSFPLRPLGNTGLCVTELGFGTAPLGNLFRPLADADARATLAAAENSGFGYYDTAPFYGFGLSERRLGDALRGRDVVLSTKVGAAAEAGGRSRRPERAAPRLCHAHAFEPVYDYSYDAVMRSFEQSLQRLGLSRIDILYIHDIGHLTHGDQNAARMAELTAGGGLKALEELRASKAISGFGMGRERNSRLPGGDGSRPPRRHPAGGALHAAGTECAGRPVPALRGGGHRHRGRRRL